MELSEYQVLAKVEGSHWWFRHLHWKILQIITSRAASLGRQVTVFDAGCGTGGLLSKINMLNCVSRLAGSEPNEYARKICTQRQIINVNPYRIEQIPDEQLDASWDIVLCIDVLVHQSVSPTHAVANLSRMLAPNGLLIINVASMPCLARSHDLRVHGVRRFVKRDLECIASTSHLSIQTLSYWNCWLVPGLLVYIFMERRKLLGGGSESDLAVPHKFFDTLFYSIALAEYCISKIFQPLFGVSLFAVFAKKK